ncbi:FadR/GntR family transcriptional regulator [Pelagibacterium sp.]|uniref:FadR/GntR family transcriptional regulator n=1 Tax=Pelagibacterium sp. TaxID=1967288 RepID=UPI003BAA63FD
MTSTTGSVQTRDKLHSTIASAVEERILAGELPVGEKLPSESDLAREFGVSTRSVREAVQILETKGLVRRRHGERTTVVRADVGEFLETLAVTVRQLLATNPRYLTELMVVRRMIESDVLDLLMAEKNADLSKVENALDDLRAAGDAEDFARFTAADAAFHQALVDAAGNTVLSIIYNNLHGLVTEVIRVTSRVPTKSYEAAYSEHADIYNRIRSGDVERAKSLIRAHIENSAQYLSVAIEKAAGERDGGQGTK